MWRRFLFLPLRFVVTVGLGVCLLTSAAWSLDDAPLNSADLSRQYRAAHAARDWAKAIDVGKQWTALKPKDAEAAYNLACAYALSGDKTAALEWLGKAGERGFDDARNLMRDPDLASLHDDPEFDKVVAKAKENLKPRLDSAAKSKPMIVTPPSVDATQPVPVIVALHGYGGNAERFVESWKDAAAEVGAVLVLPRATRAVSMSGFGWGSVEETTVIVDAAVEQAKHDYKVDPTRIILTGFSQGGMMAYELAVARPEKYRGVISVAGALDASSVNAQVSSSATKLRFYLMIGADDRPGTNEVNQQAAKQLEASGVKVRLVEFPQTGHEFPKDRVAELKKAIAFVMEGP